MTPNPTDCFQGGEGMSRLPVKDMPPPLARAAREQGYDNTHEMALQEALRGWAEWEIGDPQWATDILRLADEFREALRKQT